jgi:amino acid transporter
MMDELPPLEAREKEVPRWVQVPIGLVLGLLTLLCGFASVILLLAPNKKSPILAIVVGLILLLGCLWVLEKCFRLLTGRKNRGSLMTPNTLRLVSFFFLVLPVAGSFTGYYRQMGPVAIFQAVMYFFSFLGLRALARKREANRGLNRANERVIIVKSALLWLTYGLPVIRPELPRTGLRDYWQEPLVRLGSRAI